MSVADDCGIISNINKNLSKGLIDTTESVGKRYLTERMNKNMKAGKFLSLLLAGCMLFSIPGGVQAQENTESETIVWEESVPVPTSSESGGSARASWGYGNITSSNPLTGCPRAKANTYTYSGTAYMLWARIDVIDDNSISTLGPQKTGYNVSSVTTSQIISDTEKCFFIGNHKIQDTSSSGVQTATSNKSY